MRPIEVDVNRALMQLRAIEMALHGDAQWEIRCGTEVHAARAFVYDDRVEFDSLFPSPHSGYAFLLCEGEEVLHFEIPQHGEIRGVGFIVSMSLSVQPLLPLP